MSAIDDRIRAATERLRKANQEYFELEYDEDSPQELGPPATADALFQLESAMRHSMPPSYKAFLKQHDGWRGVTGNAMLLPTDEHSKEWVSARIKRVREHYAEFFDAAVLEHAFFVMLGKEEKDFAYLDLAARKETGEVDVVYADLDEGEVDRFPDFAAFLEDMADTAEDLVREAS